MSPPPPPHCSFFVSEYLGRKFLWSTFRNAGQSGRCGFSPDAPPYFHNFMNRIFIILKISRTSQFGDEHWWVLLKRAHWWEIYTSAFYFSLCQFYVSVPNEFIREWLFNFEWLRKNLCCLFCALRFHLNTSKGWWVSAWIKVIFIIFIIFIYCLYSLQILTDIYCKQKCLNKFRVSRDVE